MKAEGSIWQLEYGSCADMDVFILQFFLGREPRCHQPTRTEWCAIAEVAQSRRRCERDRKRKALDPGQCGAGRACAPRDLQAHETYLACDNAHSHDYPTVSVRPRNCNLGLGQSMYQSQPMPGKAFSPIALRGLAWHGWGRYGAMTRGLGCNVGDNGAADMSTCGHVTMQVYKPLAIGPAGFASFTSRSFCVMRGRARSPTRTRTGTSPVWTTDYAGAPQPYGLDVGTSGRGPAELCELVRRPPCDGNTLTTDIATHKPNAPTWRRYSRMGWGMAPPIGRVWPRVRRKPRCARPKARELEHGARRDGRWDRRY